jgi:hypothetical protein
LSSDGRQLVLFVTSAKESGRKSSIIVDVYRCSQINDVLLLLLLSVEDDVGVKLKKKDPSLSAL